MGREILVDGYNVIKRGHSFQNIVSKNLGAARELLITQLVSRYRHTPHQVIVVFDGDSMHEQVSYDRRVRIIYSRHNETADSVIARLAGEARAGGREVEMYSDDGEVRQAVMTQGGAAYGTSQLITSLNAAPKDVERRWRHRQAMRSRYGLDTAHKPDDDQDLSPAYRPTGGHKKKRRR